MLCFKYHQNVCKCKLNGILKRFDITSGVSNTSHPVPRKGSNNEIWSGGCGAAWNIAKRFGRSYDPEAFPGHRTDDGRRQANDGLVVKRGR
ncbi:hypothetical protein D3C75_890340 [compost metagenome]